MCRIHRSFADRLWNLVAPVRRYRCRSVVCGWEGLLPRNNPRGNSQALESAAPNRKLLMKNIAGIFFSLCAMAPTLAQTNVGISVGVAQPGLYGRIDIGNFPAPPVVYAQPLVIHPTPVAVYQRPIYLYVPPGHQKNWSKHCSRYNACGQPVYFVQEGWVREHYAQRPNHEHRGHGAQHKKEKGHHGRHRD